MVFSNPTMVYSTLRSNDRSRNVEESTTPCLPKQKRHAGKSYIPLSAKTSPHMYYDADAIVSTGLRSKHIIFFKATAKNKGHHKQASWWLSSFYQHNTPLARGRVFELHPSQGTQLCTSSKSFERSYTQVENNDVFEGSLLSKWSLSSVILFVYSHAPSITINYPFCRMLYGIVMPFDTRSLMRSNYPLPSPFLPKTIGNSQYVLEISCRISGARVTFLILNNLIT